MATRSTISLLSDTGVIFSVYCHWDGYLEHNGKMLHEHYTTMESVQSLVSLGSMSSLGENIIDTVYYHRDRDEAWATTQPTLYSDWKYFVENMQAEEYNYIFTDGEWYLIEGDSPENAYMTRLSTFDEINHPHNSTS